MEYDGHIILHSEAFAELEQARRWYEEQAAGLGGLFFQEVQYAVGRNTKIRKRGQPIPTEQEDFFFTNSPMRWSIEYN